MLKESEARKLNMVDGIMVYLSNYLSAIYLRYILGNYVLLSALLYSAHVFYFHGHRVVSGAPTIISLFLLGYGRKAKRSFQKSHPITSTYISPVILVARGHGKGGQLASSSLQG